MKYGFNNGDLVQYLGTGRMYRIVSVKDQTSIRIAAFGGNDSKEFDTDKNNIKRFLVQINERINFQAEIMTVTGYNWDNTTQVMNSTKVGGSKSVNKPVKSKYSYVATTLNGTKKHIPTTETNFEFTNFFPVVVDDPDLPF